MKNKEIFSETRKAIKEYKNKKDKRLVWRFFNEPTWTGMGQLGWLAWFGGIWTTGIAHWICVVIWMTALMNWMWRGRNEVNYSIEKNPYPQEIPTTPKEVLDEFVEECHETEERPVKEDKQK